MSKKKIIIISVIVLAIIVLIYVALTNKKQSSTTSSTSTDQSTNYFPSSTSTNSLVLDQNSGQVSQIDSQGATSPLTTLADKNAYGLQLSPDGKSLLYANDTYSSDHVIQLGENPDAQTLTVKPLDETASAVSLKNIFSPTWVSPTRLVFLDFSKNQIVVFDSALNKEIKRIANPLQSEINIYALDQDNIILSDYTTDASKLTARILNLTSGKATNLASADNLSIKTKLNSKLLTFSKTEEAVTSGILYNWASDQNVLNFSGDANQADWSDQQNLFYFIDSNSALYKTDLNDNSQKLVSNDVGTSNIIRITPDGQVYINSDKAIQIY